MLTDQELARWRRDGYLVVSDLLTAEQRGALPTWAETLRSWAPRLGEPSPLLHQVRDGRVVSTENAADQLDGLGTLLRGGPLSKVAAVLLGEDVVLHSDVIRYEQVSMLPRQLVSQARYVDRHLGCVIAVDPLDHGVIEVARGCHGRRLVADRRGNLDAIDSAVLPWESVALAPGATLWLHRRTPHRSLGDLERTLEVTYSARVQGDLRAAFYVMRRRETLQPAKQVRTDDGGNSAHRYRKGQG